MIIHTIYHKDINFRRYTGNILSYQDSLSDQYFPLHGGNYGDQWNRITSRIYIINKESILQCGIKNSVI